MYSVSGGREALPEGPFQLECDLPALTYQKIALAKRKLAAELGRPVGDAECVRLLSELFLSLKEDGTVRGRIRVSSSLYRIVLPSESPSSAGED